MFDGLKNAFSGFWKYALGRGLITTAVIVSTSVAAAAGWSILVPAAIAAGSVAVNVFGRVVGQRQYEKQMLEFYKDEVAAATGKEVGQLTVADLKVAAYGDKQKDIPRNEVLSYALDRQKAKSWLTLGTATAAGLVTFGLLAGTPMPEMIASALSNAPFGSVLAGFSSGIVAAISSIVVHRGLDGAIGNATRINHLSAHDRILLIEQTQSRGKYVNPIQVFDVFVAANPTLNARLGKQYGERYQGMNRAEKATVIKDLGVTNVMLKLSEGLSNGSIEATELAFIANGAEPLTARGKATMAGTEVEAHSIETRFPSQSKTFAERVGGSRSQGPRSFAARVEASRAQPAQAQGLV